jgi:hypothetical protein
MIDLDVPQNDHRTTLLHWLVTDIDISRTPASVSTAGGAPYLQPNPPAGDSAHRYVFLLYAQPDGFAIPSKYSSIIPPQNTTARIGFDLNTFVTDTSLKAPLAANYITVQSTQSANVSTTFPPAGGATGSSTTGGTVVATGSGASSTGAAATTLPNGGEQDSAPLALGMSVLLGLAAFLR